MTQAALSLATFVDMLRWRSAQTPHQRAFGFLCEGGQDQDELSYAELDARARAVAALLQAHGTIGDRALLVYPPGLDFVAALFGCLYAGWIAVPMAAAGAQHLERLNSVAQDAQASVALATRVRVQTRSPLGDVRWLATDTLPDAAAGAWQEPQLQPADIAILQYTSGSTGSPRGVVLSHGNLVHNTRQIERRFEIDPDSRGVIWLPPFHDMGLIGGILQGIQGGFPISLMSPVAFVRRPARWLEAITDHRATISGGPNFAYDLCVERIGPRERVALDLSSWEVAFNGAEPVRARTLQRFSDAFAGCGFRKSAFYPCYGLAEATLMVSGGRRSEAPRIVDSPDGSRIVSCGSVIDDHELLIVDPATCLELPAREVGEIWLRGPSVAHGYWGQSQLTTETFDGHLADTGDGPFLRTGDLGFVHAGELCVTGRLKALLLVGGRNLHAEAVEHTVATSHAHGWPGGVAAVSIDDAGRERLVVFQEVATRADDDLDQIVRAIRLTVAVQHQVPVSAIVLVRPGTIARTSSSKLRRHICREAFLNGSLDVVLEWRLGARP